MKKEPSELEELTLLLVHNVKKTIAENLHKALEKKRMSAPKNRCEYCNQCLPHYTQEWVGEQIGVNKSTIVHYFQGNRTPSIPRLMQIAEALDVSLFDLLKDLTNNQ